MVQSMLMYLTDNVSMEPDVLIHSPTEATHLISFKSDVPSQKATVGDIGGGREFIDVNERPTTTFSETPAAEKLVVLAKTSRLKSPAYGPQAARRQRFDLDSKSSAVCATIKELLVIENRVAPLIFADIAEAMAGCVHPTLSGRSLCGLCNHENCSYLNRPDGSPFFSPFVAVRPSSVPENEFPLLPPPPEPVLKELSVSPSKYYHPSKVVGGTRALGLSAPAGPLSIDDGPGVPRATSTQQQSAPDTSFSAGFQFSSPSNCLIPSPPPPASTASTSAAVAAPSAVAGGSGVTVGVKRPSALSPIHSSCAGDLDCDDSTHVIKFSRSAMRPFLSSSQNLPPPPPPPAVSIIEEVDLTEVMDEKNDFSESDYGANSAAEATVKVEMMEDDNDDVVDKENATPPPPPPRSVSKGKSNALLGRRGVVTPKSDPVVAQAINDRIVKSKELQAKRRRRTAFERSSSTLTSLNFDGDLTRHYPTSPMRPSLDDDSAPSSPLFHCDDDDDDDDVSSICPEQDYKNQESASAHNVSDDSSVLGAFSPLRATQEF